MIHRDTRESRVEISFRQREGSRTKARCFCETNRLVESPALLPIPRLERTPQRANTTGSIFRSDTLSETCSCSFVRHVDKALGAPNPDGHRNSLTESEYNVTQTEDAKAVGGRIA
jgi:hypothetical protein